MLVVLIGLIVLAMVMFYYFGRSIWVPVMTRFTGKRTVADAVREYGPTADRRLAPYFGNLGLAYPPVKLTLLALKDEKRLELWADDGGKWRLVREYDVMAASGTTGPKLAEGDWQVPEGFYRIEGLNPNSSYHLSLKLNYPNEFDLRQAKIDGRTKLGGDIFIHGKAVSIGCLAMGDEAIEELFVLTNHIGKENVSVIIVPHDLRIKPAPTDANVPPWALDLYAELTRELSNFKR